MPFPSKQTGNLSKTSAPIPNECIKEGLETMAGRRGESSNYTNKREEENSPNK
jgi:hypothetical protein